MPEPLKPEGGDEEKIVNEIVEKVRDYENNSSGFYDTHREIADYYRNAKRTEPKKKNKGISSAVVAEITRATETLGTVFYKMLMSQTPNFYLIKKRPNVTEQELRALTDLYVDQERNIELPRWLMRGLRTYAAFGGLFSDEHWRQGFGLDGALEWEATGFTPKTFLEIAFDRSALDPNTGDWIATLDFVSGNTLARLAANDPFKIWSKKSIDLCRMDSASGQLPARIIERLQSAGYTEARQQQKIHEAIVYRGLIDALGGDTEMIAVVLNRKYLAKLHKNRLPHRMIRYTGFIEFENEPLGYGVGNLGLNMQKDITANRNRMFNIITFALYSLWLVSRSANVDEEDMQVKPWNIIYTDDKEGVTPIRPDVAGVAQGMRLDTMMKDDFRGMVAATSNLQAEITEATAREVTLAQGEAIRRVSVYGEVLAESLIRKRLERNHYNNFLLLDRDIWITYEEKYPLRLPPSILSKKIGFRPKIITDKDFTPTRMRRLIEFLQILAFDKNPANLQGYNTQPLIREIARMFEIDAEELLRPPVGEQEAFMGKLAAAAARLGFRGGRPFGTANLGRDEQEALKAAVVPTSVGTVESLA